MAKPPPLTTGAKLLRKYLEEREITRSAAAKQIKASPAAVQYWLTGGQRPRADIRSRIEKWTGGAVPAESWLRPDELKAMQDVEEFHSEPADDEAPASEPKPKAGSSEPTAESKAVG